MGFKIKETWNNLGEQFPPSEHTLINYTEFVELYLLFMQVLYSV